MTAEELLNKRFEEERSTNDSAWRKEWNETSARFGPPSQNPNLEAARGRALASLRKEQYERARAHREKYNKELASLREVDRLIDNPEKAAEVKHRLMLSGPVEQALYPKEEREPDVLTEESKVQSRLSQLRGGLGRFDIEGPSSVKVGRRGLGRLVPFPFANRRVAVPGGGVLVKEEVYDEKTGKTKMIRRNATREEIEEWASLTEEERRTRGYLTQLRKSDVMAARLQTAAINSSRISPLARSVLEETDESEVKDIDQATAIQIYNEAGGDPVRARQIAKSRGFRF